ncbi:hypothetical protein PLESTM_000424600 [Pleodorina starrii]|nr:hypothetical protein PLESTM_000424600 [Pleodorina starrii]
MVTFGAPRVGNEVFVKDFNAVLPDAWRVHNHNDMVTRHAAPHEVERWWVFKVLSTTPVSSHLEFRYQDTMLQMVRAYIRDKVPEAQGQQQAQQQQQN